MKIHIVGYLILLLAGGCATAPTQNLTREEWVAVSEHTFKNTDVNNALSAAEQVLALADPSDITVQHMSNRVFIKRKYTFVAGFFPMNSWFDFDIEGIQKDRDVTLQLLITAEYPNLTIPGVVKHSYNLFYRRMDALMYDGEWLTCGQALNELRNTNMNYFMANIALAPLCRNVDDNIPENKKQE